MRFSTVLITALWLVGQISGLEIEFDFDTSNGSDALPSAVIKTHEQSYDLNLKGLDALEKKEYDLAMTYFDEALKLVPNYSDAENNRGVVYFRQGTLYEARRIWTELSKREPRYGLAWHNLGVLSFYEKKYQTAENSFLKALKINKRLPETLVMLGRTKLRQGNTKEALDYLEKAYKLAPEETDVWRAFSYGLILAGDTSDALAILAEYPEDPESLKIKGTLSAIKGDYRTASALLEKAARKTNDLAVLEQLATIQIEAGQFSKAAKTLDHYFSRAGSNARADLWLLAGIAAKEQGAIEQARQYFEQGLAHFSDDPLLTYNLGQIYYFQNQFTQAENLWSTLSDTLQDPGLYYMRALTAQRRNEYSKALQLIQNAIKLDEKAQYFDVLGTVQYRMGKKTEAVKAYKKALRIDPNLRSAQLNLSLISKAPEDLDRTIALTTAELEECTTQCEKVSFRLAILQYYNKDTKQAITTLQDIPFEKKDEKIYRHLSIFYRDENQLQKAIEVMEEAKRRFVLSTQADYELAETYLLAGYFSKAVSAFTDLVDRWDQNPWRLFYQLGYAYMELNKLEKAQHFFERSITSKRDNIAARGLLAFVHNLKGDVGIARDLWEKTLKEDPDNPTLWINMGLSYENEGRYQQALDAYHKAASLKTDNAAIQINIGNAYVGLDRNIDAMHAYSLALDSKKREVAAFNIFILALKMDRSEKMETMHALLNTEFPGSVYTNRANAEMYLFQGDTTKAIKALKKIQKKDEIDWLQLTHIFAYKGDREQVTHYLDKLPETPLWETEKMKVKAILAYETDNCSEALSLWENMDDTSFVFQYNKALAAYQCKRYAQVIQIGERIVKGTRGKDRADVCRLVGNAAFALKKWQKAKSWYTQLSNIEADKALVQYNLAVAYYNLDDIDNAWRHYTKAKMRDPSLQNDDIEKKHAAKNVPKKTKIVLDSTEQWYNEAVDFHQQNKLDKAEVIYQKILEKDPDFTRALNNLGAIYASRGDLKTAEKYYVRSVSRHYDVPESYANLIQLYLATGNIKQARRWIIKGRGHNPESEMLLDLEKVVQDSIKARE